MKSTFTSIIFLLSFPTLGSADNALDQYSFCGQRGSEFIPAQKEKIAGNWTLTWTKGVVTLSGNPMPMEEMPPELPMVVSFENNMLLLRGETVKRDFAVAWDEKTVANFDAPDDAAFASTFDTGETETLFNCTIKDTPYLFGKSIGSGTGKGPQTDLHLWMFSSEQMLGLSVAETGPAVARMMFLLTKKK